MSEERFNQLENMITQHTSHCERRFNERDEQFNKMLHAQAETIEALNHLTTATKDMIETYNHIRGAVVIGQSIQKFGLWLIKWPLIGAGLYGLFNYLFHPPKF